MGAHDGSVRTRPNGPRMQTEEKSEALTAGAREISEGQGSHAPLQGLTTGAGGKDCEALKDL